MSKIKELNIKNFYQIDLEDAKQKMDKLRPLLIDLEFSASGKVINRRIYPPSGHRSGLSSWTVPFAKPVLIHHDSSQDPIGRVHSVRWEDTEDKALAFLKGDVGALAEIKRAFATNDAKAIKKTMKKHGALSDKWPGLGRLVGKIKVVDLEAVQKFMDERYLTFSAGQGTDQWTCMSCGSDWQAGDICDHRPGDKDEDGDSVIFLCGNMFGKEISVEHEPANDTSIVLSMEFEDSKGQDGQIVLNLIDAVESTKPEISFELESEMNLQDLASLEIKTAMELLFEDTKLQQFRDALTGDSAFEVNWLIRIHDALHSQYDYELKWRESKDLSIPTGVFKLHSVLHDLAETRGFRDAVMNGHLDHYGSDGAQTDEYLISIPGQTEDLVQETLVNKIIDRLKTEVLNGKKEKENEVEVLAEEQYVEDENIDWVLMDLALDAEVGAARLSGDKRKELSDESFCGPGRFFPICDREHVLAAKQLVERARLSDDQKTRILACVDRKAKASGLDTDVHVCQCSKCDSVLADKEQLAKDYEQALKTVQGLSANVLDFGKMLVAKVEPSKNIDQIKLDELLDWFSNIVVSDNTTDEETSILEHPAQGLKPLEDSKPQKKSIDTLGGYEKRVVNLYQRLVQDEGQPAAGRYLISCRRYLPDSFNPEDYE